MAKGGGLTATKEGRRGERVECGDGSVIAGGGGQARKERVECGEGGIIVGGGGQATKKWAECGNGGVDTSEGGQARKERAELVRATLLPVEAAKKGRREWSVVRAALEVKGGSVARVALSPVVVVVDKEVATWQPRPSTRQPRRQLPMHGRRIPTMGSQGKVIFPFVMTEEEDDNKDEYKEEEEAAIAPLGKLSPTNSATPLSMPDAFDFHCVASSCPLSPASLLSALLDHQPLPCLCLSLHLLFSVAGAS